MENNIKKELATGFILSVLIYVFFFQPFMVAGEAGQSASAQQQQLNRNIIRNKNYEPPKYPDLVPQIIQVPDGKSAKETLQFKVKVYNYGDGFVTKKTLMRATLYQANRYGTAIRSSIVTKDIWVPEIIRRSHKYVTFYMKLKKPVPGRYGIHVFVDANRKLNEGKKENNNKTKTGFRLK